MSLWEKRIIYLGFILFFVLVTPLILLFAAGFRYDARKNLLLKTGAINIETHPRGAEVFLNNQRHDKTTPARITRLLPQEYQVSLRKDGYFSWEKSVQVEPGEGLFINSLLFRSDSQPQFIGRQPSDIPGMPATSTLIRRRALEYKLESDTKSAALVSRSMLTQATGTLTLLPAADYVFYESPGNWLAVYDETNLLLYLYQLDNSGELSQQLVIPGVKSFDWNETSESILYLGDFELWTVSLADGRKQLISRLGSGLTDAVWHPSGEYLIFASSGPASPGASLGGTIKLVEAKQHGQRQSYELARLDLVDALRLDASGDTLYIQGEADGQSGWFTLLIR